MTINEAYELLREKKGTYGAVAEYLGMTRDHYCALRHGRRPLPKRTEEYIILKAKQAAKEKANA